MSSGQGRSAARQASISTVALESSRAHECFELRDLSQQPTRIWRRRLLCMQALSQGFVMAFLNLDKHTVMGGLMKLVKTIPIGLLLFFLFILALYGIVRAQGEAQPSDPAAYYKAKCVACHGQKAEKKFDASLTDEQYVDVILKGKKPEKPPNMPG